jgi:hypothetical protein
MRQKNHLLIFSRPLTFFGTSQNLDEEIDDMEEQKDFLRLGLEANLLLPFQFNIGLFLYWDEGEFDDFSDEEFF